MGKYLKLFNNYTLYRLFMGENMILPNVSYCLDENEVYMSKENRIIAKYNVISTSDDIKLYDSSFVSTIQRLWIDDIEQLSILDTHRFENIGEHEIKILLKEASANSINNGAFYTCTNLTSIIIPEDITSINNSAFSGCNNLIKVILPEGLTVIGDGTFNNCNNLTNIVIPNSVISIGEGIFNNCSNLTNIMIPESVTSIEQYAFSGCSSLTNIVIPEGVTAIGNSAFSNCSSLTNIVIPENVTLIGNYSLAGCNSLLSIIVDENNLYYDSRDNCNAIIQTSNDYLIAGCKNTEIPNTVKRIDDGAFCDISSLTEITLSEGLTNIRNWSFSGTSLSSIIIPSTVTAINYMSFYNCSSLESITVKATSVPFLAEGAFDGLALNFTIFVPESVINTYKTTTTYANYTSYWSYYADKIQAIPE